MFRENSKCLDHPRINATNTMPRKRRLYQLTRITELDTTPTRCPGSPALSTQPPDGDNESSRREDITETGDVEDFDDGIDDRDLFQFAETRKASSSPNNRNFPWSETSSAIRRSSSPSSCGQSKEIFGYSAADTALSNSTPQPECLPSPQVRIDQRAVLEHQEQLPPFIDFSETATTIYQSSPSATSRISKKQGHSQRFDHHSAETENEQDEAKGQEIDLGEAALLQTLPESANRAKLPANPALFLDSSKELQEVGGVGLVGSQIDSGIAHVDYSPLTQFVSLDGASDHLDGNDTENPGESVYKTSKLKIKRKQRSKTPLQFDEETHQVKLVPQKTVQKSHKQGAKSNISTNTASRDKLQAEPRKSNNSNFEVEENSLPLKQAYPAMADNYSTELQDVQTCLNTVPNTSSPKGYEEDRMDHDLECQGKEGEQETRPCIVLETPRISTGMVTQQTVQISDSQKIGGQNGFVDQDPHGDPEREKLLNGVQVGNECVQSEVKEDTDATSKCLTASPHKDDDCFRPERPAFGTDCRQGDEEPLAVQANTSYDRSYSAVKRSSQSFHVNERGSPTVIPRQNREIRTPGAGEGPRLLRMKQQQQLPSIHPALYGCQSSRCKSPAGNGASNEESEQTKFVQEGEIRRLDDEPVMVPIHRQNAAHFFLSEVRRDSKKRRVTNGQFNPDALTPSERGRQQVQGLLNVRVALRLTTGLGNLSHI